MHSAAVAAWTGKERMKQLNSDHVLQNHRKTSKNHTQNPCWTRFQVFSQSTVDWLRNMILVVTEICLLAFAADVRTGKHEKSCNNKFRLTPQTYIRPVLTMKNTRKRECFTHKVKLYCHVLIIFPADAMEQSGWPNNWEWCSHSLSLSCDEMCVQNDYILLMPDVVSFHFEQTCRVGRLCLLVSSYFIAKRNWTFLITQLT